MLVKPLISSKIPAMSTDFSTTEFGPLPSKTFKASLASKAGPIALPKGCSPKVNAASTLMPNCLQRPISE